MSLVLDLQVVRIRGKVCKLLDFDVAGTNLRTLSV